MTDKSTAAKIFPDSVKGLIPTLANNEVGTEVVSDMICDIGSDAQILIVGCGDGGSGHESIPSTMLEQNTLSTDVSKTSVTDALFDAQNLPLIDDSVDIIICQAVLEHIKHGDAAVDEMLRVLKPGGRLFVDIPFMQPYHGLPHDYRRYTEMGLDALFEDLDKIDGGPSVGPTTALFWVLKEYIAFILSFGNSSIQNIIAHGLNFMLFWSKYVDKILFNFYSDSTWALKIPSAVYYYGKMPKED